MGVEKGREEEETNMKKYEVTYTHSFTKQASFNEEKSLKSSINLEVIRSSNQV